MTGLQPVAWAYELATTVTAEGYGGWMPRLTYYQPAVPNGAVRNIVPLFAADAADVPSPPATPQVPEDVRARAILVISDWLAEFSGKEASTGGMVEVAPEDEADLATVMAIDAATPAGETS